MGILRDTVGGYGLHCLSLSRCRTEHPLVPLLETVILWIASGSFDAARIEVDIYPSGVNDR